MIRKIKTYSGSLSAEISERELANRAVARAAAIEGIVLLQNDGLLPLKKGERAALFGSGAQYMVKGGTGSGDVNERETVDIYTGMKNAGFIISNEGWLTDYRREYETAREKWKAMVLDLAERTADAPEALNMAYAKNAFIPPAGRTLDRAETDSAGEDIAIYILSRKAGESADRLAEKGDYYISDDEGALLDSIRGAYNKLVVVLNCGPVDLNYIDSLKANAIIYLSQPGMEGGNAFADILCGKAVPSGKMTDTWAYNYGDYPSAMSFGQHQTDEYYTDGIYVGYRYFDTFGVKARVPFGFGLSYTDFCIEAAGFALQTGADAKVTVTVEVRNTGAYPGKEVVQIYAHCPQGRLAKEFKRLCAFGKTKTLAPDESCTLELSFPVSQLAAFSEEDSAYILESGKYVISVGNSSADTVPIGVIALGSEVALLRVEHICPVQKPLREIQPQSVPEVRFSGAPELELDPQSIHTQVADYSENKAVKLYNEAKAFVETLSEEQLISLTSGDPDRGQYTSGELPPGFLCVPGCAGETSDCASIEPLASMVLADGPAGVRLFSRYQVLPNGSIIKPNFTDSIEHGLFSQLEEAEESAYRYQYCTAFPVGSMLAQSWNTQLMRSVGRAAAIEMEEFGISVWLAPGMNIHRNPLCGRNYEYYSEDPLLTGVMASAMVSGVQSVSGTGATVKHFACNNRENNRKQSDSVVSERALREIYLRGFEIAIKQSQPMAIMTSYNLLNGVHTANSRDLIYKAARCEWGFEGMFMTDWVTTGIGGSSPAECMRAGNDLIMPGSYEDMELLRKALRDGTLSAEYLKKCAANIVRIIWQSLEYKGNPGYSRQFNR